MAKTAGPRLSIGDAAVEGFGSSDEERQRFIASKLYPDLPLDQAVQHVQKVKGEWLHSPDGKTWYPAMGRGVHRLAADIARGAGDAIPAAAGTAGAIFGTMGAGPLGGIAGGGSLAAAGEVARQKIGDSLMGPGIADNTVNPFPVTEQAAGGMLGGAGAGVGKATAPAIDQTAVGVAAQAAPTEARAAGVPLTAQEAAKAAELDAKAKAQDVPLTLGEATNNPRLLAQQKRLGNITATSAQMADYYEQRDQKVFGALTRMLDRVSGNADAYSAGAQIKQAALDEYDRIMQSRAAAARPLYEKAYANGAPIDTAPIISSIDKTLQNAVGENKNVISTARSYLVDQSGAPKTDLASLHQARMAISDLIDKAGQTGMGNTARRSLTQIKGALTDSMNAASPEYKAATKAFMESSAPLDDLAAMGLKSIAELNDDRLQKAAAMLLGPTAKSPAQIYGLRRTFETAAPEAWQSIKRVYMQDQVARAAMRVSEQGGNVMNPAGKIYKALMNGPTAANLKAALSPEEWMRMMDLTDVMQAASRVKPVGSDTAWNQLINEEAKQEARPLVAALVRNANPWALMKSADEWLTARAVDKKALETFAVITRNDPAATAELKELRKLAPGSVQWRIVLGSLVGRGAFGAASALATPPSSYDPGLPHVPAPE